MKTKSTTAIFIFLFFFNNLIAQPSIQWEKSLGGYDGDYARSIQQTTDGGYIVAGYSESIDGDVTGNHGIWDYWVVKLSDTGMIEWQKSLGGSFDDEAYCIKQTTDGGYIVAGYSTSNSGDVTNNHGGKDYWIVKLNSTGAIDWQKSFGGSSGDEAYSIQQTTDGGYIVAGISQSNDFDVSGHHGSLNYSDCWILKIDNVGTLLWQKSLGGSGRDYASEIQQTLDGGYIVAGYSESADGDLTSNLGVWDYWVVKLNDTAGIVWQKSMGGGNLDKAFSIIQTTDGGYIVGGEAASSDGDVSNNLGVQDYWIVKLNNNGSINWQKSIGGTDVDGAYSIRQTTDGGYIISGYSRSFDGDATNIQGGFDCWVVKLFNTGAIDWQKSFGSTNNDEAFSIIQTLDGGYIFTGYSGGNTGDVTNYHGNKDYWIVKLNPVSTGIDELSIYNQIKISPNPATTEIKITNLSPTENQISIINLLGQQVKSIRVNNVQSTILPVSDLPAGMYVVTIFDGENSVNKKLVKE